ncbi:MAG: hypothetical protein BroJett026_01990 [Betaproteobacteria bacterium]|nr:MAG: hypothetical protein BroJett026_01990 [Betaproteobacteria bacterium]
MEYHWKTPSDWPGPGGARTGTGPSSTSPCKPGKQKSSAPGANVAKLLQIRQIVTIRPAERDDPPAPVAIDDASIPGRMPAADTGAATVAPRAPWAAAFDPPRRPRALIQDAARTPKGWRSPRTFDAPPACEATVVVGAGTVPPARRGGRAQHLAAHALAACPSWRIRTLLASLFAHDAPSFAPLAGPGFVRRGLPPRVADLDGLQRDLAIRGPRLAGAGEIRP